MLDFFIKKGQSTIDFISAIGRSGIFLIRAIFFIEIVKFIDKTNLLCWRTFVSNNYYFRLVYRYGSRSTRL